MKKNNKITVMSVLSPMVISSLFAFNAIAETKTMTLPNGEELKFATMPKSRTVEIPEPINLGVTKELLRQEVEKSLNRQNSLDSLKVQASLEAPVINRAPSVADEDEKSDESQKEVAQDNSDTTSENILTEETVQENPLEETAKTVTKNTEVQKELTPVEENTPQQKSITTTEINEMESREPAQEQKTVTVSVPEIESTQEETTQVEAAQEETSQEEVTQEEVTQDEASQEEVTQDEALQEEATQDEAAQEEATQEEASQEEATQEEASQEEVTQEEATQEETTQDEAAQVETSQEDVSEENSKVVMSDREIDGLLFDATDLKEGAENLHAKSHDAKEEEMKKLINEKLTAAEETLEELRDNLKAIEKSDTNEDKLAQIDDQLDLAREEILSAQLTLKEKNNSLELEKRVINLNKVACEEKNKNIQLEQTLAAFKTDIFKDMFGQMQAFQNMLMMQTMMNNMSQKGPEVKDVLGFDPVTQRLLDMTLGLRSNPQIVSVQGDYYGGPLGNYGNLGQRAMFPQYQPLSVNDQNFEFNFVNPTKNYDMGQYFQQMNSQNVAAPVSQVQAPAVQQIVPGRDLSSTHTLPPM